MERVPREVWLYVFSFLSVKEVSAIARRVCREWSLIASDDYGWKETLRQV